MQIKKHVAIIVDAFVTGSFLAPALLAHGVTCIHVRSQANVRDAVKAFHRPGDFIKEVQYTDDESLREALSGYKVQWVLAGCEMGVRLAAHLAELFDISARNDAARSVCWRNKYEMHEALKRAGVRSMHHLRTRELDRVFTWKQEHRLDYPIVVKPIDSSGSDNVHICENEAEVRAAFEAVISATNTMLQPNTEVLVQEFLRNNELIIDSGTQQAGQHLANADVEYCVNTVSYAGRHFVSEIIKVHRLRVEGTSVHDYNELLCPVADAGIYEVFSKYVFSVLDALGIKYGPCHSELMVVGKQPVLLESAARLPGGIDLSAYTKALGYNQLMLWIQSCISPRAFIELCTRPRLPLNFHSSCVFLISDIEGDIQHMPDIGAWLALPSAHSASVRDNGRLARTTALTNYPGYVFLLNKDKQQLQRDRSELRRQERAVYERMIAGSDR
ncbi:ATP-grasp domain-containing protein [Chitinimonas naiadis]